MSKRKGFTQELSAKASLDLIDPALADDIEQSVRTALKSGAVFKAASDLDSIFRDAVAEAITDIEEKASLLRRFLIDGPYEQDGDIPLELQGKRLSDEETDKAVAFIYSHVVTSFQGRLAELLAAGSCAELAGKLTRERQLPATARLYVGDAVLLSDKASGVSRKAADMHLISMRPGRGHKAVIGGVVEVKSYPCPPKRLQGQLDQHITRIRKGAILTLSNEKGKCSEHVAEPAKLIFRIGVTPSTWKLPRTFSFKKSKGRTMLHTDTPGPPNERPLIEKVGAQDWRVVMKWSQEALASSAYEMSFWYMEQLGEMLYRNVPREWSEMTPAEAGRNAAKMMLYYAILRCTNSRSQQRAIALYNSYGFGYAIGMNFRDAQGRREMLWPEDLHEISKAGVTKHGCRIAL